MGISDYGFLAYTVAVSSFDAGSRLILNLSHSTFYFIYNFRSAACESKRSHTNCLAPLHSALWVRGMIA